MLLSIVVPALNEEKNLPKLFESLKKQTFKDFEVILADASSTDRTKEIAKEYGALVVQGGTPSVGRNAGAKVAKGKLILFLDSDVVLSSTFLEKTLREFQERNLDGASSFSNPISKKKVDKVLHEISNYYSYATEKFLPHAAGFCILVKREIHEKIGGFDESLRLGEDHEYIQRVAQVGKFEILTKPRIDVSVRRFEADGRFGIAFKYLLVEAHRIFFGEVRSNFFKYEFSHYEDKKNQEKERKSTKTS